jgi:dimethylargininase
VDAVASVLSRFRRLHFIQTPGTLDGGDVMRVGDRFFIGLSRRTNPAGADQLADILRSCGYAVARVPVGDGLHLKSSVNPIGDGRLLVADEFAGNRAFDGCEQIRVDADERRAANTLLVNGHLITPAGCPKTQDTLRRLGREIHVLDMSEAQKMDGGLTCLSIRF